MSSSASDNLDVITDHFDSLHHFADRRIVQTVIDKLGMANVFTDEALAEIADHYAWKAERQASIESTHHADAIRSAGRSSSHSGSEAA